MYREEDCGCGGHGQHHGKHYWERQEGHSRDCGCGCHQYHRGVGFHRRFVSREEAINNLEEYLKQLQAEAKGAEERIAELKKEKK